MGCRSSGKMTNVQPDPCGCQTHPERHRRTDKRTTLRRNIPAGIRRPHKHIAFGVHDLPVHVAAVLFLLFQNFESSCRCRMGTFARGNRKIPGHQTIRKKNRALVLQRNHNRAHGGRRFASQRRNDHIIGIGGFFPIRQCPEGRVPRDGCLPELALLTLHRIQRFKRSKTRTTGKHPRNQADCARNKTAEQNWICHDEMRKMAVEQGIGLAGFEPTASASRTQRSTKLSYSPKSADMQQIAAKCSPVLQPGKHNRADEKIHFPDLESGSMEPSDDIRIPEVCAGTRDEPEGFSRAPCCGDRAHAGVDTVEAAQ